MANIPSFRNGKLAGNVNLTYHRMVNVDIARPPYADKLQPLSFFLKKRKGYRNIDNNNFRQSTDVVRLVDGDCSSVDGAYYFYQVSPDRLRYRIMKLPFVGGSLVCAFQEIDSGCRCFCGDDKFSVFDYVKGNAKFEGSNGVQGNSQNQGPRFYDTSDNLALNKSSLGDYILVHGSRNRDGDGYCGQVRSITGTGTIDDEDQSDFQYGDYVSVDAGRSGFQPEQEFGEGLSYKIFSDRGRVFAYHTCDGIKVWHSDSEQTVMCDYGTNISNQRECITALREHNGLLTFTNESGFNFFGGATFDKFFVNAGSANFVSSDVIATVRYRNFLMFFGRSEINTVVFAKDGNTSFRYSLRNDMGIWSKDAYVMFENSLYFMGTDKRIYATSISSDGDNFQLQLEDISARIKGDLDLIKDGDEVGLSSDGNRMYVFINGKGSPDDDVNTKTKILIWNRDYDVRLEHRVCCASIKNKKESFYLGDGLYDNCDVVDCNNTKFEARIEAFITDNDNQQTDGQSNPSDVFRKKKLNFAKILLGKGQYTDDNTFFIVESYRNGYKMERAYTGIEGNEWIDNWNKVLQLGEVVDPGNCILEDIEECGTIFRKCEGSKWTDELKEINETTGCNCPPDPIEADDYCVCVDSKAYALQPFYNMFLDLRNTKKSDLFKITIVSQDEDTLYFGGMIVKYETLDIMDMDGEGYDFLGTNKCPPQEICVSNC